VSFSAFNMLNFVRGSVYIRYFDKTKSKKETDELNEVKLIYYFSNDCDVFEEVKNLFHLAKDRVNLFNFSLFAKLKETFRKQVNFYQPKIQR
jgi:hypothetical protein